MQTDVGETRYCQESDNAQPVCADLDGVGFCSVSGSNLFELPIGASRFEAVHQSGLDESLVFEARSLEIVPRDSANLTATRSWRGPSDKLLGASDHSEPEFGLEVFDRKPISLEDSQRVYDNNSISGVTDAWVDEENPNGQVDGRNHADQSRKLTPGSNSHGWNDGQEGCDASADSGVEADLWSNGVHASIIPTKSSTAAKMREETK